MDTKLNWAAGVIGNKIAYPVEYVIRMFKGQYPRLNMPTAGYAGKRLCDVGFGDGRNFPFLQQCGFELAGAEVNPENVEATASLLGQLGVAVDLRVGTNDQIPFVDEAFDYVLSWNAGYYMGPNRSFDKHVSEFARVLRPGGTLVFSIPKSSCFIYEGSDSLDERLRIIRKDPYGERNGHCLAMFRGESDIAETFGTRFDSFVFGSIEDDCFGRAYHWHIGTCQRKRA